MPRNLFRKLQFTAESTKSWQAEVVETTQLSGAGMNMHAEIRIKIAAEVPLKKRWQNSGDDQTILICDGTEFFYSGDGHGYYRGQAEVNPDCNFPLSKFYKLADNPTLLSIVGRDHVRLGNMDRECVVLRAEWTNAAGNASVQCVSILIRH